VHVWGFVNPSVLYFEGDFSMTGGNIHNNEASSFGGGVYVALGSFTMTSGNINNNESAFGGGVIIEDNSTFTLIDGSIHNNTARDQGGGVEVFDNSTFTMSGGSIHNNLVTGLGGTPGYGGGVNVMVDSVFNMTGGSIHSNEADYGGGVAVALNSNLNISGSSSINDNTATYKGGGIYTHGEIYNNPLIAPAYTFISVGANVNFFGNYAGNGLFEPPANWDITNVAATTTSAFAHALNNWDINFEHGAAVVPLLAPKLTPSGNHTFPTRLINLPPLSSHDVTLSNVGNLPTGPVTLTLTSTGASAFSISQALFANIAPGEDVIFTVAPVAGLPLGTHTATVVIDGVNLNAPLTFVVSFTVLPAEDIVTPSPAPPTTTPPTPPTTPQPPDDPEPLVTYIHHAFIIGFTDGTVRPSGTIPRAQAVTIIFRLMSAETRAGYWRQDNPFDDVSINRWFNNSVSTIANTGWLENIADDDMFMPHDPITRAEFIALMARFMDVQQSSGDAMFTDISGHWAEGYINALAELGKLQGPSGIGGPFLPNQTITRAEAAAIVIRMLARLPENGADGLLPGMNTWPDNANQNAWYFLYVQLATNSFYYEREDGSDYITLTSLFEPWLWERLQYPTSRPEDIFR